MTNVFIHGALTKAKFESARVDAIILPELIMNITTEYAENCQVILTIEAEAEEMGEALELAYRKIVKDVRVPGFRKGKAPRPLLEQYVGRRSMVEEAVEYLVPHLYNEAIERTKIEPIADPQMEIVGVEPVTFKATVPLRPIVDLKNYRELRLTPEEIDVTDEQVDNAMEALRDRQAVWDPIDREVRFGDLAIINVQMTGEGLAPKMYEAQQYAVIEGAPYPVPGFPDQVVGMNKAEEEEKEFTLSFPDDYDDKDVAGRAVHFKVQLLEVKEKHASEWNDELAKSINSECETVDMLRERVTANLKDAADREATSRFEEKLVDMVADGAEVEFPPILTEREIDGFLREQAARFGGDERGLAAYLQTIGKTETEFKDELRLPAEQRVKRSLVLGKAAEEGDINIEAAEVDVELEVISKGMGDNSAEMEKAFNSPGGRHLIEQTLLIKKTKQWLAELVTGAPDKKSEPSSEVEELSVEENSIDSDDKDQEMGGQGV